jgi:alkanesulfonate monooxygenase SsuD/methylene tetrahydromethanopterin reductase-like flavin-dependent oxidoreductase (luciferase family)
MQIGIFSNGNRHNQVARDTYEEDLRELVLADELGIQEAWVSEHGVFVAFQAPDQLPSADLFICRAASMTKQIKMGPGIRSLPFHHPLQIATEAAVCDHLTNGRYHAGFGVGTGVRPRGPLPGDQRAMFREAVEIILRAWTSPEPFDCNGEFWPGDNYYIIPKPLTKPHMDVGIACSRSEGTLEFAAQKGFMPLMIWNTPAQQIKQMIDIFLHADSGGAPQPATRDRVRVARVVYVTDSVAQAKKELHGADLEGQLSAGRLDPFLLPGDTRSDITFEYLIDRGAFYCGDPDTVYNGIKSFYDEAGGFGVLMLVMGKDWGTEEQRARSMRWFMQDVAPRLAKLQPPAA